jgi:hypothetical protein
MLAPKAIWHQLLLLLISLTGLERLVVVLSPNCPQKLRPHTQSVPSVFIALVGLVIPAAVWHQLLLLLISLTGLERLVVVLSPNEPLVL